MKRILAFILLLITLTAVFTPCCASDNCNETTIAVNEHQDDKDGENCSPFVTCGYCPGFAQLNATGEIPVIISIVIAHHSRDTDWFSSTYTNQLLQPPKTA